MRRDGQSLTFRTYAAQWLKDRKAQEPPLAAQTLSKDRRRIDSINLTLGDMIIGEITRADVKAFQTAIMTADETAKLPPS